MKRFLVLLSVLTFLGCSDLDFVYGPSTDLSGLKKDLRVSALGDDSATISNYFLKKFSLPGQDPQYLLEIESQKIVTASVVEKDATASKFIIQHTLNYNFFDNKNNCLILNKKITSKSSYDSKSAGYSFGTDLSARFTSTKNIELNIESFLQAINSLQNNFSCNNEN